MTSQTPAGNATPLAAAVQVPLSYFVTEFRVRQPKINEPSYEQLQPFIEKKIATMKEGVAKCVGLKSSNDVSMETYVDPAPALSAGMAATGPSVASVSLLLGGHAKEIALGALAVMSLFMASMMVRKGAPMAVPLANIAAAPTGLPTILEGGEPLAGEASAGNPLLDGMELNEDAVRAQQMVDQVSTMVKENPEAAANLVKRWMNRS
jgi:flagellar biosynthesis/type III secretory pathway M-ring protein FliF/YscJ